MPRRSKKAGSFLSASCLYRTHQGRSFPGLEYAAILSRRLRKFTVLGRKTSLSKEVPGRLAAYLLYMSEQRANSEDLKLDIAKNQLASLLGTIPETLSRVLARMVGQGLIRVDGSRIKIVDRQGLAELARRRDVFRTERRETMRTSWRIFTIFGIEIRIDSSWILIFGLVTWALARYYFPSQYPHWPQQQSWLIALSPACCSSPRYWPTS